MQIYLTFVQIRVKNLVFLQTSFLTCGLYTFFSLQRASGKEREGKIEGMDEGDRISFTITN